MDLHKLIDSLCDDEAPHFARDYDGIEETRKRLYQEAVSASDDGAVIFLESGGEYHTHLCHCEVCEGIIACDGSRLSV